MNFVQLAALVSSIANLALGIFVASRANDVSLGT